MVLHAPEEQPQLSQVSAVVTSVLTRVECLRAIERLRLTTRPRPEITFSRYSALQALLSRAEALRIDAAVLDRASEPFQVVIKTLDAIHLATALLWREQNRTPLLFATHDHQLARAARAVEFEVIGL